MARLIFVASGVIGVLILTCLWVYAPATHAADKRADTVLSGKPILIQAKNDVAFTLEMPEVRQLGGRTFVVGREMKDDPYKYTQQQFSGGTVWVPVDGITVLVELEPPKPGK